MAIWFGLKRLPLLLSVAALTATVSAAVPAADGTRPESRNMRLVGYSDLQARSAYQPVIQKQGSRWIAYIEHHGDKKLNPLTNQLEDNGTSIIDVADPRHPKYLFHIPGEEGKAEQGGAQIASAAAPICPRPIEPSSTCCGRLATRPMRFGMSDGGLHRHQFDHHRRADGELHALT